MKTFVFSQIILCDQYTVNQSYPLIRLNHHTREFSSLKSTGVHKHFVSRSQHPDQPSQNQIYYGDVSNHQPRECLLNRLLRRTHQSSKTSKLCVTGLCEGNSPVTGEFPSQRASNAENVSIWWRHHGTGVHKHLVSRSHCSISIGFPLKILEKSMSKW